MTEPCSMLFLPADTDRFLGRGAVAHEGRMIDEPIAIRARRFVERYDALQTRRLRSSRAREGSR